MKLHCKFCGDVDAALSWQTFSNATTHIRADCTKCGAYIAYVPQTPENLTIAGRPPTTTQAGGTSFFDSGPETDHESA